MASPSCHRRRPGAWRLRTSTHRRHPPCLCTCTYTAASSPHARGASTRRAARRRAQRDATRRAPLLGGTSRADRASRPAGLLTPRHAPAPPPLNALMHRVAPQRAGGSRRRALAPRRWAPAMPAQPPHTHLEVGLRAALIPRGDGVEHLPHTHKRQGFVCTRTRTRTRLVAHAAARSRLAIPRFVDRNSDRGHEPIFFSRGCLTNFRLEE